MDVDELPLEDSEPSSYLGIIIRQHFIPLVLLLIGVSSIGIGLLMSKGVFKPTEVTVLESPDTKEKSEKTVVIEVGGAVAKPGVYTLSSDSRVNDALTAAGGLTDDADTIWVNKTINRAAKITDGQKLYIPSVDEQKQASSANNASGGNAGNDVAGSTYSSLVNINTASAKQLEALWGIGQKIAQNIIEQRPYSSVEELVSKHLITSKVFERIKDQITVY